MAWGPGVVIPVHVVVPAPADAFPPMHFNLRCREDAEKRLVIFLRSALEAEAAERPTSGLLLQAIYFRHAIDALLDGLLEVIRSEQDWLVEQWWCESWPGTAPPEWPEDQAAEVAA